MPIAIPRMKYRTSGPVRMGRKDQSDHAPRSGRQRFTEPTPEMVAAYELTAANSLMAWDRLGERLGCTHKAARNRVDRYCEITGRPHPKHPGDPMPAPETPNRRLSFPSYNERGNERVGLDLTKLPDADDATRVEYARLAMDAAIAKVAATRYAPDRREPTAAETTAQMLKERDDGTGADWLGRSRDWWDEDADEKGERP